MVINSIFKIYFKINQKFVKNHQSIVDKTIDPLIN